MSTRNSCGRASHQTFFNLYRTEITFPPKPNSGHVLNIFTLVSWIPQEISSCRGSFLRGKSYNSPPANKSRTPKHLKPLTGWFYHATLLCIPLIPPPRTPGGAIGKHKLIKKISQKREVITMLGVPSKRNMVDGINGNIHVDDYPGASS